MQCRVSVIKRLSLYGFALWGQDLVSVVRIIEVLFKENMREILSGRRTLSIIERCPQYRGVHKERFDCIIINIITVIMVMYIKVPIIFHQDTRWGFFGHICDQKVLSP